MTHYLSGAFNHDALDALVKLPLRMPPRRNGSSVPHWFTDGRILVDLRECLPSASALIEKLRTFRGSDDDEDDAKRGHIPEETILGLIPVATPLDAVRFTALWQFVGTHPRTWRWPERKDDESTTRARFCRGDLRVADVDAKYVRLLWTLIGPWDAAACEDERGPVSFYLYRKGEMRCVALIMPIRVEKGPILAPRAKPPVDTCLLRAGESGDLDAPLAPQFIPAWEDLPPAPQGRGGRPVIEADDAWVLDAVHRSIAQIGGVRVAGLYAHNPRNHAWALPTRGGTLRLELTTPRPEEAPVGRGKKKDRGLSSPTWELHWYFENIHRAERAKSYLAIHEGGDALESYGDVAELVAKMRRILNSLALAPSERPSRLATLPYTPMPWPSMRYQLAQQGALYRVVDTKRPRSGGVGQTLSFSLASAVAWKLNETERVVTEVERLG